MARKGIIGVGTQMGLSEKELVEELSPEEDEEEDGFIFWMGNETKKGITLEKGVLLVTSSEKTMKSSEQHESLGKG